MVRRCKILAFLTMIKFHRRNSCIYTSENLTQVYKSLKMSYNTFHKYFSICIKEGFIIEDKGAYRAIKLRTAMQQLDLTNLKFFHQTEYDCEITFKNVYKQIQDSLLIRNFQQQQYKIEQNKDFLKVYYKKSKNRVKSEVFYTTSEKRVLKKLIVCARKAGMSTDKYIKRIEESSKEILTGKFHASNILGMSPASGANALKRLSKSKIQREKVSIKSDLKMTDHSFEILKAENPNTVIVPTRKGFFLSKGSIINLDTLYINNNYSIYNISRKGGGAFK